MANSLSKAELIALIAGMSEDAVRQFLEKSPDFESAIKKAKEAAVESERKVDSLKKLGHTDDDAG